MNRDTLNRRDLVRHTFSAAAVVAANTLIAPCASLFGQAQTGGAASRSIRLGGPDFAQTEDPEALATAHRKLGYRAAYCPNVGLTDTRRIRAIADAFTQQDVVIAEVGRWCNLLDADPDKRRRNLEDVTQGLALAEAIAARCCVDIAGSYNPGQWDGPHPDNVSERYLHEAVDNARKIIDAVKPRRAKFCYEMMPYSLPDSPDSAAAMVRAVDRAAFGVHLDPCNLVNSPARLYDSTRLIHECFDKLGRWIVSCHAKDADWAPGLPIHIAEVRPGTGRLDLQAYVSRLAQLPHQPPLMLEHLPSAEEYDKARRHMQELLSR